MSIRSRPLTLAACLVTGITRCADAQTAATGSAACGALYQTASTAASNRVAADDKDISQPQSIKSLTCLDNFFKGVGLNVVINLLDPTQLLNAVEGELCNALTSAWKKSLGGSQCGITLTGFNLGTFNLGGLGGGLSCPKLSFGGGGPPLGYIGVGANNSGKLSITGKGLPPTGYTLPTTLGLW